MQERYLLILGLLLQQSQHGYLINEFIDRNLAHITNLKKATAYATLERLETEGFVKAEVEQEGNRPPRKVYSITPAGETKFLSLLRASLAKGEQWIFPGDTGLMFLHHLPATEAAELLQERLNAVNKQLNHYRQAPAHRLAWGVQLTIDHVTLHLEAEQQWLTGVIGELQQKNDNKGTS